jgi:hypothetical protein
MAKVPVPIEEVMSNPNLSISSSPFAPGKMVIKRSSFRAGETPDHLEQYAISSGSDAEGTVVYEGKPIPRAAAETFGLDVDE